MTLNAEHNFIISLIRHDFDILQIEQLDYSVLDWERLLEIVENNRIFPLFYKSVKSILPLEWQSLYATKSQKQNNKTDQLVNELHAIYKKSKEEKIRFLIVKGIPLALLVYDNIYDRQMNDIDILVEEEDAIRMDYLIRQLGYIQPYSINWSSNQFKLLPYPVMRLRHTNHFFEYFKFGNPRSKVEIHKYLYYVRPYIKDFLWSSQGLVLQNILVNTLDMDHTLVFLFTNAFQNSETLYAMQGKTIFRDYIDLYFFLKKYVHIFNWSHILDLMSKYNTLVISKTVLNNLKELFPENILIDNVSSNLNHDYTTTNNTLPSEMKFLERIFCPDKRKAEVKRILKQQIFADGKYASACKISDDSATIQNRNYITYHNKLNLDIKYLFTYLPNGLVFKFRMEDQLKRDFHTFMIQISIFNNDVTNQNLYSIFEIFEKDESFFVRHMNTPIMRDANVVRRLSAYTINAELIRYDQDKNIFELFMPYSIIGSNPLRLETKLAYEIDLFKYVYGDVYHFVEDVPPDIRDATILTII